MMSSMRSRGFSACVFLALGALIFVAVYTDSFVKKTIGSFPAITAKLQTSPTNVQTSQTKTQKLPTKIHETPMSQAVGMEHLTERHCLGYPKCIRRTPIQMSERLSVKSQVCTHIKDNNQINKTIDTCKRFRPVIWYTQKHNISYCSVGKTAGTFIKQLFSIIVFGNNSLSKLESGTRLQTHVVTWKFMVPYMTSSWRRSRLILVGRNPYTRLYSAYVDRISVPSITGSLRPGGYCRFDVTFQEFLQIILYNTERSKLDLHWSPIYLICKPCNMTTTYLLKQETFMDDIKFVIDSLNLTANTREALDMKLQQPRTTWTITGIVRELFESTAKSFTSPNCIGWFGAMKRLWRAFQIQGYIDENVDMPVYLYNRTADFANGQLFLKTVLDTIAKHPLSKEMQRDQRHRALVNAYRQVDRQIIERIKLIFKPDFDMFGYSDDPPA